MPLTSPLTSALVSSLTSSLSGDGGGNPIVSFSQASYTEGDDDGSVVLTIRNATDGAAWGLTVSSDGGGTPVTDSGTVSASTFTSTLDLTGLNAGTLTASYEEASVEVATDTAILFGASAGESIGMLLTLTKAA